MTSLYLIEEEKPLPSGGWQVPPWPLDLDELGAGPDADQEPEGQHQPPQPGVLIPDQLGVPLHDQGPLGEREAEPGKGPVPRGDRVAETHQQKEANPVKQEGRQEGGEECKVGAQQGNVLIKKSLSIIPLSPPIIVVNDLLKTFWDCENILTLHNWSFCCDAGEASPLDPLPQPTVSLTKLFLISEW